jgi:lipoprotein signal peptidase
MSRCCSFRGLFWGLAVFGVAADQISKYRVFRWLYNDGRGDEHEVIPGVFRLCANFLKDRETGLPVRETGTGFFANLRTWGGDVLPQVNQGALFGLFNDHREAANAVFAAISVLAALAILYWGTRGAVKGDGVLTVALGLILAGTLGNLYDRVVFGGVRDFLHFYYINWPVFNVADCCLVCGACLLLVQAFLRRPAPCQTASVESGQQKEVAGV